MSANQVLNFQLPQDVDTPPTQITYGYFTIRIAYARSADSISQRAPGQDYLALRLDGTNAAFALCDGVGQSFFGEVAARLLGDCLLDFLWSYRPSEIRNPDFDGRLVETLMQLTQQATLEVQGINLDEVDSDMLREVLERKRELGSEAMFVAGLISAGQEHGNPRTALVWLGDSRIEIFEGYANRTSLLEAAWDTDYRWSTSRGVIGDPSVYVGEGSNGFDRIICYSDGLATRGAKLPRASDIEIIEMINELRRAPESDDISMIDLRLTTDFLNPHYPMIAPSLVSEESDKSSGGRAWRWGEVAGAEGYQVELEVGEDPKSFLEVEEARVEFDLQAPFRFRVRAIHTGDRGPWSAWHGRGFPPPEVAADSKTEAATDAFGEEEIKSRHGISIKLVVSIVLGLLAIGLLIMFIGVVMR